MSIEQYDQLLAKIDLYSKLAKGLQDVQEGKVQPFDEAMDDIRKDLGI